MIKLKSTATTAIVALLLSSLCYADNLAADIKKSGRETKQAFKETARDIKEGSKKLGHETAAGVKKAGREIKEDMGKAARETKEGFKKAGGEIKEAITGK